jgi:predicted PurR-regulated permease PerM
MKANFGIKDLYFFVIFLGFSLLALVLFSNYISLILIAYIVVTLFHPVYKYLAYKINPGIAVTISVFLVLIFLLIPIFFILSLSTVEIKNLVDSFTDPVNLANLQNQIDLLVNRVNDLLGGTFAISRDQVNIVQAFNSITPEQLLQVVQTTLFPFLLDTASFLGQVLFALFLFIISLIYLFPNYEKIGDVFKRFSPIEDKFDDLIYLRFRNTLKGVVSGTFVVALCQATAVILPLIALNVGAPILLWIIMVVLSIIPIGSGLVWFPAGVIMIVNGLASGNVAGILAGIFVIVYSAIIINVVDTVLRPRLMRNAVDIHPMITIFSVLGGITLFGIMGIIYGPVLVVMYITLTEIYKTKYLTHKDE